MKISYDQERDLMYILMAEEKQAARTETVSPGVFADFDRDDQLIGIEIIDASDTLGDQPELSFDLSSLGLQKTA